VILTTGGTGLSPRDVTPEATRSVIEYEAPGIPEAIRVGTAAKTRMAMLSRAVAGMRAGCLVINLPGSTNGVREALDVVGPVIGHAIDIARDLQDHPDHQGPKHAKH
jgi:molybdenum cofactor synthesis domain-containing protein